MPEFLQAENVDNTNIWKGFMFYGFKITPFDINEWRPIKNSERKKNQSNCKNNTPFNYKMTYPTTHAQRILPSFSFESSRKKSKKKSIEWLLLESCLLMEDDTKRRSKQWGKPIFYEIADKEENEGRIILDQCVLCERCSNEYVQN